MARMPRLLAIFSVGSTLVAAAIALLILVFFLGRDPPKSIDFTTPGIVAAVILYSLIAPALFGPPINTMVLSRRASTKVGCIGFFVALLSVEFLVYCTLHGFGMFFVAPFLQGTLDAPSILFLVKSALMLIFSLVLFGSVVVMVPLLIVSIAAGLLYRSWSMRISNRSSA